MNEIEGKVGYSWIFPKIQIKLMNNNENVNNEIWLDDWVLSNEFELFFYHMFICQSSSYFLQIHFLLVKNHLFDWKDNDRFYCFVSLLSFKKSNIFYYLYLYSTIIDLLELLKYFKLLILTLFINEYNKILCMWCYGVWMNSFKSSMKDSFLQSQVVAQ